MKPAREPRVQPSPLGFLPWIWAASLTLACARVPTPLAPTVRGSVGLPYHGLLTASVELPQSGPGYQWLVPGGHHHGTQPLVSVIQEAARRVAEDRPGGEPLLVGDLSSRSGGQIPHHRSHRSGRDADLLLYTTTLTGHPVPTPGWIHFGPDGLGKAPSGPWAGRYLRLDVERQWALTRALLQAPQANVLWLFVSRPIEALLTEYAISAGEDPELVWQAETVMLQPKHALPHDDHFHLRIACTPELAIQGCDDGGVGWPWLPAAPALHWPSSEDEIAMFLNDDAI